MHRGSLSIALGDRKRISVYAQTRYVWEMESLEKTIVVNAPVAQVYWQWTRVEEFPLFMKSIREVQRIDEQRFLLKSEREGHSVESVAEITLTIPEQRFAWRTVAGAESSGVICVKPISDEATEVTLKMKYVPDADRNRPAALSIRLEANLAGFKEYMENAKSPPQGSRLCSDDVSGVQRQGE